tara:strand:- start:401 stop:1663 length:1263 start_codon:yes stop_codon:yes gene_type:complete
MNYLKINIKLKYYLEVLILIIAFSLPFEKILMRFLLVVFALLSILTGDFSIIKKKYSWYKLLTILLWLIPLTQLIFLDSLLQNFGKLETKLSLFIIPVFMLLFVQKKIIPGVFKNYIFGIIISCFFCLSVSIYNYFIHNDVGCFFYAKLSLFHHPSYFAMYLNFAIGLLLLNNISPFLKIKINRNKSYLLIVFLTIFVVLLSSRTGWITNILIQFIFLIFYFKNKAFKTNIFIYIIVVIVSYVSIYNIPNLKRRAGELTSKVKLSLSNPITENQSNIPKIIKKTSSTNSRKIAWELSIDLIKNKFLFGYGTGLGQKELNKKFFENGYKILKNKSLNCHNQFLQFQLDHGLIGSICLLFFTFIMLIFSLVEKDYLYALFLTIIILNFMTESMLETQSGVVFFSFFNTLFFHNFIDKKFNLN